MVWRGNDNTVTDRGQRQYCHRYEWPRSSFDGQEFSLKLRAPRQLTGCRYSARPCIRSSRMFYQVKQACYADSAVECML